MNTETTTKTETTTETKPYTPSGSLRVLLDLCPMPSHKGFWGWVGALMESVWRCYLAGGLMMLLMGPWVMILSLPTTGALTPVQIGNALLAALIATFTGCFLGAAILEVAWAWVLPLMVRGWLWLALWRASAKDSAETTGA